MPRSPRAKHHRRQPFSKPEKVDMIGTLVALACFVAGCSGALPRDPHPLVIISMDGMAWQIVNASTAPNLARVAEQGVRAKYTKNVTPTKTWPNHHSYMTGLYPESHGIVSNEFWDPMYQESFIYEYDCSIFDPKFFNMAEPIWLTLQKAGGRSGVYFWPGASGYGARPTFYEDYFCPVNCSSVDSKDLPAMRNRTMEGWPPYVHCYANYSSHPFKSRVDTVMDWLKSDKPPEFVALYFDEPDWKGHGHGPESSEYREAVTMVDDVVGYLIIRLEKANLLNKVNLMFVSDHGMVTTSSDRQIYLDDYLDPTTYRLSDSGALGHLWPAEGKLDEVYDNLTRVPSPHMTVYKKADIPESFHWKHNRRIPPIFINPALGWQVQRSRPSQPTNWTGGSHGWPAVDDAVYSVFFARGPAFRKGVEVDPFNTVDLYPLMAHLLGVHARPNNGSFQSVAGLLSRPPQSSTRRPDSGTGRPSLRVVLRMWLLVLCTWSTMVA